jgi:inorganic pyrophosphatase
VAQENHSYAHVKRIGDLGKKFVRELEDFFVNYHQLLGKKYSIIGVRGPATARRLIKAGMRAKKGVSASYGLSAGFSWAASQWPSKSS